MTTVLSITKSKAFFYTCCVFFLFVIVYSNYQYYVSQRVTEKPSHSRSNGGAVADFQQAAVSNATAPVATVPVDIPEVDPTPEWVLSPLEVVEAPADDEELKSITPQPEVVVETLAVSLPPPPATTTATTTPKSESTDSPATPVKVVVTPNPVDLCGNSVQDVGEECDDGNANNHDMCLNNCRVASCRDGIVNEIIEQCDDGNSNGKDNCTNQCTIYVPVAE